MKISTAIRRYLISVRARGLSDKTHRRYRDDLLRLERFLAGRRVCAVKRISADALRAYFAQMRMDVSLRHRSYSDFTIEGRFRSVKTFMQFCFDERWILNNPMLRLKRPRLPERIVPRLDDVQMIALLGALNGTVHVARNRAMIALMLDSGMRRGEVVSLELGRMDLKRKLVRVIGKGNREGVVPLSGVAVRLLRRWLRVRPRSHCLNCFVKDDGEPITGNLIRMLFERLDKHLSFHVHAHLLRHSFANHSLARHRSVKILQQTLRHKDSRTTLNTYVRFDERELVRVHARGSPLNGLRRRLNGSLG